MDEPEIQRLLKVGEPEMVMRTNMPDGVCIKARLDWVAPMWTLDLKTFAQKRGKSIDRSVADAIQYESYYRQAYFYDMVRRLARKEGHEHAEFIMAFVESEPPHEVRIRSLRPKSRGEVNLYWERARIETRGFLEVYAACMAHFGVDKPWRYAQEITLLGDEEMPGMGF